MVAWFGSRITTGVLHYLQVMDCHLVRFLTFVVHQSPMHVLGSLSMSHIGREMGSPRWFVMLWAWCFFQKTLDNLSGFEHDVLLESTWSSLRRQMKSLAIYHDLDMMHMFSFVKIVRFVVLWGKMQKMSIKNFNLHS